MASRHSAWWTVVAGTVGTALGTGILVNYGVSIFAKSISADYGWSREVIALCLSINLVMNGISALIVGEAISRYGMRWPTIACSLVFGLSLASIALVPASPLIFYLLFALMGLAGAATTAMPYAAAICRLFDRRRGLALGLAVGGGGIGATTVPHIATWLIAERGWHQALVIIGVFAAIAPALATFAWVRQDGPGAAVRSPNPASADWHHLLRSREFLLIAFAIGAVSVATLGVLPNVIPMLTDRGMPPATAALSLSFFGLASWFGRLVAGYILDKVFAPWVTIGVFVLAAVGCAMFTFEGGLAYYSCAASLVGLAIGAEADLATYLISRYIDPARFARAAGAMWVLWSWGGGLGIFIAGHLYTLTHGYAAPLWVFVALLAIASIALSRLGPYIYVDAMEASPADDRLAPA